MAPMEPVSFNLTAGGLAYKAFTSFISPTGITFIGSNIVSVMFMTKEIQLLGDHHVINPCVTKESTPLIAVLMAWWANTLCRVGVLSLRAWFTAYTLTMLLSIIVSTWSGGGPSGVT